MSPERRPIEIIDSNLGEKRDVVLFRGKINPEAGIRKILEVVKLCPDILFIICSPNFVLSETKLTNLLVINRTINAAEMRYLYSVASLSIGQFGEYPRLRRTIPHKAFEAAYFGLPYLSIDSPSLRELFPDERHALLTDETSEIKISTYLKQVIHDKELLTKISHNSNTNYKSKFSQEHLASERYRQIMAKSKAE